MEERQPGEGDARLASLRETLDSLREGLQILSPDWRYLYVNDAVLRHGRKAREELLGQTMQEVYPGIERTPLFAVLDRCMRERKAEDLETEFAFEDGARAWFELRVEPCSEGLVVLSLDVSQRKRLEATAHQTEKLRALGQLAAGVAHDLKNMLHPLFLQLELLRRRLPPDSRAHEVADHMAAALQRGNETVDLLRDLGRLEPTLEASPVDLNAIVHEAAELCRLRIAEHRAPLSLEERLAAPSLSVRASPSELLSAVVNLLVNAVDALSTGGGITIRTGRAADSVWVEVQDDGPGMSPEVEARAFEPFFTTKGFSGTGLGLAMVYATVTRHGGSIRLRTAPGEGTSVTLSFPPA